IFHTTHHLNRTREFHPASSASVLQRADIQARRLKLKELMPDVELMQKTLGEMNGDAELRGSGNSVAALLGNSNGNLKLLMNDGLVSRNLMEIVGLNVGNYIVG
ncbi:AsmA family protein, partial [Pseudomonas aeruginosa]|uniref:AsmA family protein n=1 Tax=Pseudomonas aeruginosa TaxID=287 RepID=UPI0031B6BB97